MARKTKSTPKPPTKTQPPSKGTTSFGTVLSISLAVCLGAVMVGLWMVDESEETKVVATAGYTFDPSTKSMTVAEIIERGNSLPCNNRNDDVQCAKFAQSGNCPVSPGWMGVMCAASCNACDLLDPNVRCDPKMMGMKREPAMQPGDMNKLFEGLASRYPDNNVTFVSSPPTGPWIVTLDNFVNEKEIEALLVEAGDLRRSTDQGEIGEDGYQEQRVSQTRTSENAWCDWKCEKNAHVQAVTQRIVELTGVPSVNYESFQVLRYNVGQYYRTHHDMSPSDNDMPAGPRILTVFVYLNDVEEGGGTNFPATDGNLTVEPKKGSIAMWPSVLDEDLTAQDERTKHQALPVLRGVKYGANHWIHQYDYKTPNHWGCTGSFS